jgi:hypothetical protein
VAPVVTQGGIGVLAAVLTLVGLLGVARARRRRET